MSVHGHTISTKNLPLRLSRPAWHMRHEEYPLTFASQVFSNKPNIHHMHSCKHDLMCGFYQHIETTKSISSQQTLYKPNKPGFKMLALGVEEGGVHPNILKGVSFLQFPKGLALLICGACLSGFPSSSRTEGTGSKVRSDDSRRR